MKNIKPYGKVSIKKIKENFDSPYPNRWETLDKDLREAINTVIERNKSNWDNDKYNVMSAIDSMFEQGFFQKIHKRG